MIYIKFVGFKHFQRPFTRIFIKQYLPYLIKKKLYLQIKRPVLHDISDTETLKTLILWHIELWSNF